MEYWIRELQRLSKARSEGRIDVLDFRLSVSDIKRHLFSLVTKGAITMDVYMGVIARGLGQSMSYSKKGT